MVKVKYHELSEAERRKYLGEFYDMVSLLKSRDEVKNFFKDILTLSEVVMISRRIQVAKMLLKGKTHEDIRKKLKVGNSTINMVDKWLNEGFGGYQGIIDRYKKSAKSKKKDKAIDPPPSLHYLRKKYPAHFLLLNLFLDD